MPIGKHIIERRFEQHLEQTERHVLELEKPDAHLDMEELSDLISKLATVSRMTTEELRKLPNDPYKAQLSMRLDALHERSGKLSDRLVELTNKIDQQPLD